jgi:hypothetical protein
MLVLGRKARNKEPSERGRIRRIILKRMLEWDEVACTGFIWLKIGTSATYF